MLRKMKTETALAIFLILPASLSAQICDTVNLRLSAPDGRFVVNGDGTVSDLKTGLIWKQCHEGRFTEPADIIACNSGVDKIFSWEKAIEQVKSANLDEFADAANWRLPNIKELASLVEKACYDPAINESVFPKTATGSDHYWTSTHDASVDTFDYARYVKFEDGTTSGLPKKVSTFYGFVRLVRSSD